MKFRMSKPMVIMLVCVGLLFSLIFIYKALGNILIKRFMANREDKTVIAVATQKASYSPWFPHVTATGNVRAVNGVYITTSLAGMVQAIYFAPGAYVSKGTKLVQLNADSEIGQMNSLKAQVELAKITYARDQAQYDIRAVSKQVVQADEQNLRSLEGQLQQQIAIVQKKSLIAPFSGRLGINLVNLGQYLNPGDKVTSLQADDPVYVDFYVPQQIIPDIKVGQSVSFTSNTNANTNFSGKITTVDSIVDNVTRNIMVEATVANPKGELTPGMFGIVKVSLGTQKRYITVPQSGLSYNSYGNILYIVSPSKEDKEVLMAHQRFVKLGQRRGDQVAVLEGIKDGEEVVVSGQLKLKNGSKVKINNSVLPANNPDPSLPNEY